MPDPERHDEHLLREDITGDKVMFAFMVMAAGTRPMSTEDISKLVVGLMADAIAALLKDNSDDRRTRMVEEMRRLWALHEEQTTNPWD